MTADLVKGFKLLRLPVAPGSIVSRNLLVKPHTSRDPADAEVSGRTLFVTHLDNYVTEAQLSKCMGAAFGEVDRVEFKSTEKRAPRVELRADSVRVYTVLARVVFKHESSIAKAMESADGRIARSAVLPLPVSQIKEQVKAGKNMYKDAIDLRREIDEWMASYDARKAEERRTSMESLVDDDGFTKVVAGRTKTEDGTVVRSTKAQKKSAGTYSEPMSGVQGTLASRNNGKGRNRKKKPTEMPDFYRFQVREKRREELLDHRKRKDEDEKRVEHMRAAKRFKVAKDSA